MKKLILKVIYTAFLFGFICNSAVAAQNGPVEDSTANRDMLLKLSNILNSSNDFSGLEFSLEIKNQLKNYHLNIYKPMEMREGRFLISPQSLGKSYLEESYNVFQTDLSIFLPKPIDITLLPCKPNFQ